MEQQNTYKKKDPTQIDALLARLTKSMGKGTIFRQTEERVSAWPAISTTSLSLDHALGIGGVPQGRFVELLGMESSGKTTMALHMIAEAQKLGATVAFVDAEHALDPNYAAALGVDMDNMLISQPNTGEEALNIVDELVRSQLIDLVVVDSVAALVPKAELEGGMDEQQMGLQARLMSKACRKLTPLAHKNNVTVLWINQYRSKIGVFFGSPHVGAGGNALKYYCSVRMKVSRTKTEKTQGEATHNRTKVEIIKNKMAPPYKQAQFDIRFGVGIDQVGELIDIGVLHKIIRKAGPYFYLEAENVKLGQGKTNSINFLKENPEIQTQLKTAVIDALYPQEEDEEIMDGLE